MTEFSYHKARILEQEARLNILVPRFFSSRDGEREELKQQILEHAQEYYKLTGRFYHYGVKIKEESLEDEVLGWHSNIWLRIGGCVEGGTYNE